MNSVWNYMNESRVPSLYDEPRNHAYLTGSIKMGEDIGFKGPNTTTINFSLKPFYFVDFTTGEQDHGYKFKYENFTVGSIVDSSNITKESKGFNVRFMMNQYSIVYKSSKFEIRGAIEIIGIIIGMGCLYLVFLELIKYKYSSESDLEAIHQIHDESDTIEEIQLRNQIKELRQEPEQDEAENEDEGEGEEEEDEEDEGEEEEQAEHEGEDINEHEEEKLQQPEIEAL